MKTEMVATEILLRKGSANMWRGIEAVGGELYLTSHRLVFESHSLNIQRGPARIDLSNIATAGRE